MIEFVTGRAGYGKSEYVLSGIREDLAAGRKIWLVVPEQQELVWNGRAARLLPPDAFLHLEVAGFSGLAEAVFRQCGGLSYHYASKGGKALLMWRAMLSVRDRLRVFNRPGREDRYVPLLADAVREMKTHNVTPKMLEKAIDELRSDDETDTALVDRLSDLSLVAAAYETMLHEHYDDTEDTLAHMATVLDEVDFFRGSIVYVDSYYSITPAQAKILRHIFRSAEKVVVTFSLERSDTGEPQWGPSRRFYRDMCRLAEEAGQKPRTVTLRENYRAKTDMLRYLETNLWRYGAPAYGGAYDGSVSVIEAADRYEEADVAACRVLELVRAGARYSDIAVIARDMEKLRGIADTAMAAYGIPYYLSERVGVAESPAARLLFASLAAVEYGFQREDVIGCAKTGLTNLTDAECDAFERYTDKWKLRGKSAFLSDNEWQMNPDGFTEDWSETGRSILRDANSAREKLALPLGAFAEVFRGEPTVGEICRGTFRLLTDFGVYDALVSSADALEAAGDRAEASRVRQIWNALCDALDTMVDILGGEVCDAGSFARLLARVIDSADVGTIPSGADQVVLGSADKLRPDKLRHVIILGAVDGEFPGVAAESGFFSDNDKVRLEGAGIILSEPTSAAAEEEFLRFYRSLCAASDSVTVILPHHDTGGEELSPSAGMAQLQALFPDAVRVPEADFFIPSVRGALEALPRLGRGPVGETVRALLRRRGIAVPDDGLEDVPDRISPDTASALFPRSLSLTQSRIESFVECPMQFYGRYVLRLDENRPAVIAPVDVGNLIHAILERFFREIDGRDLPLPDGEADRITDRLVEEYITRVLRGVNMTPRLRHLFGVLRRSLGLFIRRISEEFAEGRFRPYCFEQKIGGSDPGLPPALEVPLPDGSTVTFHGTIDRLDVYRDGDKVYVRVVDYKTGGKDFRLDDVLLGYNMQMLIYLFSIWKMPQCKFRTELAGDKGILPAGVLYCNTTPKKAPSERAVSPEEAETLAKNALGTKGLLLKDENVLRAMEQNLKGKYIPVTLKNDGGFTAASSVADLETFGKTYSDVVETLGRITTEMKSGDAEARPRKHRQDDPCSWCSYYPICRRKDSSSDNSET